MLSAALIVLAFAVGFRCGRIARDDAEIARRTVAVAAAVGTVLGATSVLKEGLKG